MRLAKVGIGVVTMVLCASMAAAQGRPLSPRGQTSTQIGGSFNAEGAYSGGKWIDIIYGRPILRGRTNMFGEGGDYSTTIYAGAPIWRIGADVTDGSGETRSDTTNVPVGYTTLQATMTADAWQTAAKPVAFSITTQSLAGVPESAKGKLTVYALEQPKTIKRSRLIGGSAWPRGEEPEVDGANPETWPLGQAISTHDVETNTKGQAKVEAKLAVGVYRAILETSDRLGKPVKAILLLRVVNPAAEHLTIRLPQIVMSEKQSLEPGETLQLFWGTGYDVGRAFIEVEHRNKIVQRFWTKPALTQRLLEVPVTEEMRGGFTVHVTQVRENRMLQQTQRINVPWSNMKLKVKWKDE